MYLPISEQIHHFSYFCLCFFFFFFFFFFLLLLLLDKKKLLKSYLQLIRLKKKEKTIHSKTLFTISVDLKST